MILFPAIDLRQGRCVRLEQGRYESETRYSDDPLGQAQHFAEQGAEWLHVVDLDGAKDPEQRQLALISALRRSSNLKLQVGGGLRRADELAQLFDAGVERVVLGSLAVKSPALIEQFFAEFGPERIVLALDVQLTAGGEACVAVAGWQQLSELRLESLIERFLPVGLTHVLCTDIARDGRLAGPNESLYRDVMTRYPELALQASGGIASLDDLRSCARLGCAGAIAGKALYEGIFSVSEAVACLQNA